MIVGYYLRSAGDAEDGECTSTLRAERCLRIESDPAGRKEARSRLVGDLRNGDIFVSPSIPRLAASIGELLRVAHRIHGAGATLRLAAERIDTAIPAARNVMTVFAEYEKKTLAARRTTGLREAELYGAHAGRPRKLDRSILPMIRDDLSAGRTLAAIARNLNVHPTTVMRLLRNAEADEDVE